MTPPRAYLLIPRRLILDLGDNRLALALYCWIARLFLIVQAPVPLSRADVQRYDPSAKAGAIERALDRLVAEGWLLRAEGRKRRYTPTWGQQRRDGAALPWRMDAPTLGRPRRVATVRVDRAILDVFIGRFRPHDRAPLVERYFVQPVLSLRDVGEYLRLAAGLPARDAVALQQWGLVADGALRPIPDDAALLALASQRAITGEVALTHHGWRRLGWDLAPAAPVQVASETPARSAIPVVIPPDLIGRLIPRRIGSLIGDDADPHAPEQASACAICPRAQRRAMIPANHGNDQESRDAPPTPPDGGGGDDRTHREHTARLPRRQRRVRRPAAADRSGAPADADADAPPDTDAVRVLTAFGVVDPGCLRDLASVPLDQVQAAVAYATAEGLGPGWVVKALRRHVATGWDIPRPARRSGWSAADIAACVNADASGLFRLGSDCSDLPSDPDADPSGDPEAPAGNDAAPSSSGAECPAPAEGRKDAPPSASRRDADAAAAACSARRGRVTTPTGDSHAVGRPVRDAPADDGHPVRASDDSDPARRIRLWNQVSHAMRTTLPRRVFDAWFRRARLLALRDGAATISVPSYAVSGFAQQCLPAVQRALRDLAGPVTVRLVTDGANGGVGAADRAEPGDPQTAAPGGSDQPGAHPAASAESPPSASVPAAPMGPRCAPSRPVPAPWGGAARRLAGAPSAGTAHPPPGTLTGGRPAGRVCDSPQQAR